MTEQDRTTLRTMQDQIDALGRKVAAGDEAARAEMRRMQAAQIEFCRSIGLNVVG